VKIKSILFKIITPKKEISHLRGSMTNYQFTVNLKKEFSKDYYQNEFSPKMVSITNLQSTPKEEISHLRRLVLPK
jgi:hypothetical protein